ncbi:hypothetical protein CcaverHIS002_0102950 [Cutaneotrichosporon cavernicola]|uniref:Brain protein I3 n=1 Tax=Cutaneotrichosporon cavernicola TaxID=279322 RepID=A0AA48I5T1_9TREE|nr:uncharacterized protein CcaverHIS019_0102880 [Cutaneotrichosporon cavernicola]BEI79766.1 hypothetical protein CcaverHIS002_0102950 [Cutaneotrichosporon cavernicola]BEI87570.1 hypothetical protein CcaverHIS019_0102880 [Cutaneotrichosporon cavernicola]BEI95341.1 hypothetical protein CcaverHIS631_0102900 [Cutaneotrichosporon cavernicola]BEJ03115.1 hypothetical protein CcaverHIS641_0102900 [Cutaneotrichosporon cavernicola]
MTALTITTTATPTPPPPPYKDEHDQDTFIHEKKSALHLTSPVAPASSTSTAKYEKVICSHDVKLSPKCRGFLIGLTVINPAVGLAVALCPHGRRRKCRTCGAVVVVSPKRAFC